MPKLRDIHQSAKDTAKRLKEDAQREFNKAKDKIKNEWDKMVAENAPKAQVSGVKSDCQKNAEVYFQISQLKGHCEKSQVEVLIASLDKIGVSAPELVLFSNDLKNAEYNLTARDCAWFDGQVELYSNKLVECAKGDISHSEL